ncbi:MAG TPA: hypothetical protein VMN37_01870 [Gemmatimonadales bacterium]|nr:hypothetical protein [Gemmatimonadales bacterium]
MKKLMLMAGLLAVVAACGERQADVPPAETTGEMAPAAEPMMSDTGMMHSDTTMARDTAR